MLVYCPRSSWKLKQEPENWQIQEGPQKDKGHGQYHLLKFCTNGKVFSQEAHK